MSISWRSATATRIMLIASLSGAVGVGSFTHSLPKTNNSTNSSTAAPTATSFTSADTGACLMWDYSGEIVVNMQQVDCASPHRFEITSREDLSLFPASEFGAQAPPPSLARQAQLREELCGLPTQKYLNSTFDSLGKYSIATILPPQKLWENGDRTLLCGLQVTNGEGKVTTSKGRAIDQDQSRIFPNGSCITLDTTLNPDLIDCTKPHQLEVTSTIDLLPIFPKGTPSIEQQDEYLQRTCTGAARDYVGGDDALYYSTLTPLWTTITPNSWEGGSHSVNCYLNFPINDPTGTRLGILEGSAKTEFTIDGHPPESRPERAPIVNPEELEKVNAP